MSETKHTPEAVENMVALLTNLGTVGKEHGLVEVTGTTLLAAADLLARLRRVEEAAEAYVNADIDVTDTLALYDAMVAALNGDGA